MKMLKVKFKLDVSGLMEEKADCEMLRLLPFRETSMSTRS